MKIIGQPKNNIVEILNLKKELENTKNYYSKYCILLNMIDLTIPIYQINNEDVDEILEIIDILKKYINRESNVMYKAGSRFLNDKISELKNYYNSKFDPNLKILESIHSFRYSLEYVGNKKDYMKNSIKDCIRAVELYFNIKVKKKYWLFGKYITNAYNWT